MLLVSGLLAATPGAAQNAPGGAPSQARGASPAGTPLPGARTLSAAEQQAQAARYLAEVQTIERTVERLAAQARSEGDLLKLNCINDKLLQIRGHIRLGEQTSVELTAAALRRDDPERHHQFSKLTIIYQRVTVLGQEAEACVGEEAAYVGQTQVSVDVDADVEGAGDPTKDDGTPLPTERPPVASPTT